MEYKLSVIVPVYNVEKYIIRCIESILDQDYEDYELILVDDGSLDGSGLICDKYAEKYTHISVIHKENGGLSSARNYGIDYARGEYIVFIDSDDYIRPGMFSHLLKKCEDKDLDMALSHHDDEYNGRFQKKPDIQEFYCSGKEALAYMLAGDKIPGTACAKVIKKSCLGSTRFIYGRNYEDAMFNTDLFLKLDKVYCTGKRYYVYYHREDSITTKIYTPKALDIIYAYQYVMDKVMKYAPDLEDLARFRILWSYCIVYDRIVLRKDYKEIRKFYKIKSYLKKNAMEIVRCKYFSKARRLSFLIFKFNSLLYNFIVRSKNR